MTELLTMMARHVAEVETAGALPRDSAQRT